MNDQMLRDELHRLVEPLRARESAYDDVLARRATRTRRHGWQVAGVTAAAVAAVAVLVWVPGHRPAAPPLHELPTSAAATTPPVSPTTRPAESAMPIAPALDLPLAVGRAPELPLVVGQSLVRPVPDGQWTTRLVYVDGTSLELFQSAAGVVVFDRSARADQASVYVVEATAERELVHGVLLGVAADSTRVAYAVQVVDKGVVTSDLHLVDIASGREIQSLKGAPNASPALFDGDRVILSVGDGGVFGTGYWTLSDNSYSLWPNGEGTLPISVVGSVALIQVGDGQCVATVRLPSMRRSAKPCPGEQGRRFVALAPDTKRFAGVDYGLDTPNAGWPVIADTSATSVDERFRGVFDAAGLMVDAYRPAQLAWEDATHVLVVASKLDIRFVLRCDVVAGSCEIARDDLAGAGADVYLVSR
jgi:hypothetical protein